MSFSFRAFCTGRFVFGLLVVAVGVLFTLDNLGVLEAGRYLEYWPAGLILIGLAQFVQACHAGGRVWGLIWIGVGTWLLLERLDVVQVSVWALWPVLLVVIGVTIVWRALFPAFRRVPPAGTESASTVSALAVMSGVERVSASREFRGGDLTAVMGGCAIDLRQAAIAGEEAVIQVFAMWGGIELRVPEHWVVVNDVLPILGGVEQKTRAAAAAGPRLIVRGTVIMGGVEISN